MAGAGSTFGGIGALAEFFVADGRVSMIGGVGYFAGQSDDDPAGVAGSLGARAYVGAERHRGFVEAAYSQLATDAVRDGESTPIARLWGPAAQVGYLFTAASGLTGSIGAGVGYAVQEGVVASRWKPVVSAGVGYTFR
jgi:hypothetical protein